MKSAKYRIENDTVYRLTLDSENKEYYLAAGKLSMMTETEQAIINQSIELHEKNCLNQFDRSTEND